MTDGAAALPAETEAATAEPDWQRLHPATLALAIVKLGPRTVNFLPALAAIGIAGRWIYVLPALGAFLLISLLVAWFAWVRFRFIVGADEIVIESGVLSRQHRTIPFDRIQDVGIEQGLIARALGVAKVGFETGGGGGSKKDEARLDAIGLDAAQALRATIRAHRGDAVPVAAAPAAGESAETAAPATEDRLLFAMSPQRLLIAGLFNFSLAALAVVGGGMQLFDNLLPFDFNIFNPVDWFNLAERYGLEQWVVAHRWVAGLGAALSLLFIGFASGVLMMVLANWNFRLTREPRALRRTRGLTTRTDVALPVRRVQAAILVTGWLRKRFDWHELRLQSLARDGEKEKDHQVVPFGHLSEIDPVLGEIAIPRPASGATWQHSHRIVALGGLVGAGCAAAGGTIAMLFGQPLGGLAIAAAVLIAVGALVSARFHGWVDLSDMVAIRRGWIKPKTTLLPHASVQSVDLSTNFILRPLGLATLVFGVPGGSSLGSHEIPAIPLDIAQALRTRILAARNRR
jgi:putative membrane protein